MVVHHDEDMKIHYYLLTFLAPGDFSVEVLKLALVYCTFVLVQYIEYKRGLSQQQYQKFGAK